VPPTDAAAESAEANFPRQAPSVSSQLYEHNVGRDVHMRLPAESFALQFAGQGHFTHCRGHSLPPKHATLPIRSSIWNAPEVPPVSRHRHDSADPSVLTAWCLLGCGLATCLAIKYMPSITQHGASSGRSSCCSRPPSSKGAGPFLWPSMPWQKPAGSGGYQWRPISEGCHARLNPSDDIRPPSRRSPFAESCNLPHPQLHVR
jgi:hypothetical protein